MVFRLNILEHLAPKNHWWPKFIAVNAFTFRSLKPKLKWKSNSLHCKLEFLLWKENKWRVHQAHTCTLYNVHAMPDTQKCNSFSLESLEIRHQVLKHSTHTYSLKTSHGSKKTARNRHSRQWNGGAASHANISKLPTTMWTLIPHVVRIHQNRNAFDNFAVSVDEIEFVCLIYVCTICACLAAFQYLWEYKRSHCCVHVGVLNVNIFQENIPFHCHSTAKFLIRSKNYAQHA